MGHASLSDAVGAAARGHIEHDGDLIAVRDALTSGAATQRYLVPGAAGDGVDAAGQRALGVKGAVWVGGETAHVNVLHADVEQGAAVGECYRPGAPAYLAAPGRAQRLRRAWRAGNVAMPH